MKRNLIKLTLLGVLLFGTSSAFGQKFGSINFQELISVMPEIDSVQIKLAQLRDDYTDQLELIQVEFNNKLQDFQKNANMSESMRQLKEKELRDLQTRYEEYNYMAQQDMQNTQLNLMTPIIERAENALKKVGVDNNFIFIFDESSGAVAYSDKKNVTDVMPLVKKELGIRD